MTPGLSPAGICDMRAHAGEKDKLVTIKNRADKDPVRQVHCPVQGIIGPVRVAGLMLPANFSLALLTGKELDINSGKTLRNRR